SADDSAGSSLGLLRDGSVVIGFRRGRRRGPGCRRAWRYRSLGPAHGPLLYETFAANLSGAGPCHRDVVHVDVDSAAVGVLASLWRGEVPRVLFVNGAAMNTSQVDPP